MISITVSIPKLDVMRIRTAGLESELNKMLTIDARKVAQETSNAWKLIAPLKTGLYRGSIAPRTRLIAGITQAIASTSTRSASGFPYPRALEDSTRYHYRSTPLKGQQTAGQVVKVAKRMAPYVRKQSKETTLKIIAKLKV